MKLKRKTYLDLLRIIAILLVLFNHMPGCIEYYCHSGYKYVLYVIPSILTRINVPLFWMISGALLLRKTEKISYVFYHRVSRIALAIFLSGGILYILENLNAYSLTDFIQKILTNGIEESYWFLYTYLGVLLLLPYLQAIAQKFSQKDFIYFFILHVVFCSLIPILNYILQFNFNTTISIPLSLPLITENAFFFFFMGYYLENVFDINRITFNRILLMFLCMLFAIGITATLVYHQGLTNGFSQSNISLFDYLITFTIFVIAKYIFVQIKCFRDSAKLQGCISMIGSLTFGIYLIDPILKHFLYRNFENVLEPLLPTILCSIAWVIFSALVCGFITIILKKLPIFRRIL